MHIAVNSHFMPDIKLTKRIPKWPNCLHSQSFLPLELVISLHPAVFQDPNRSEIADKKDDYVRYFCL